MDKGPFHSHVEPCELTTGPFTVQWRLLKAYPGPLAVHHQDDPDRTLWWAGGREPFIDAGHGEAKVSESRGFFTVDDRGARYLGGQTLDTMEREGDAIVLRGRLGPEGDAGWCLRFTALDDRQLAFTLEADSNGPDPINRLRLSIRRRQTHRIFGFGEQLTHVDAAGQRIPIISQEPGIGRGVQPLTWLMNTFFGAGGSTVHSNAPAAHYLTSDMSSLYLTNTEYVEFDCTADTRMTITAHTGRLEGRILYGASPLELIEVYTRYAGRMPALPEWLNKGAIIGMQGGTEAVQRMASALEANDVPVGAYWLQDWVGARTTSIGKQLWWNWEVDPARYPGWDALVAELAAKGARVMTYLNPFLVDPAEKGSFERNLYREAESRGYLVKRRNGDLYLIKNTSFSAALLDLTNPETCTWIKGVIKDELLGSGASGWMADFGEALPFDAVLHDGSDAAVYHNRYPETWARLNREAVAEAGREGDVVFFTRSGFTQSPRYSTLFWMGDQLTAWDREDGIASALVGLLSSGFSGFSLNHGDIGGYTATTMPSLPFRIPLIGFRRTRELLWRWIELCAFTAVFRTHEGNQPDRNYQIDDDPETLAHFGRFARLYAALAPYRHTLMTAAEAYGHPVVRHPWLHFPDDPETLDLTAQFMLGSEFMVAPVMRPRATTVSLYLPAGRWAHLWSGEEVGATDEGGWFRCSAPLGQPAVFYPVGSAPGDALAAAIGHSAGENSFVAEIQRITKPT